jgi:hypothetical protein
MLTPDTGRDSIQHLLTFSTGPNLFHQARARSQPAALGGVRTMPTIPAMCLELLKGGLVVKYHLEAPAASTSCSSTSISVDPTA